MRYLTTLEKSEDMDIIHELIAQDIRTHFSDVIPDYTDAAMRAATCNTFIIDSRSVAGKIYPRYIFFIATSIGDLEVICNLEIFIEDRIEEIQAERYKRNTGIVGGPHTTLMSHKPQRIVLYPIYPDINISKKGRKFIIRTKKMISPPEVKELSERERTLLMSYLKKAGMILTLDTNKVMTEEEK